MREAVARFVRDGDTVVLEGFTHLIPFAAGKGTPTSGRHRRPKGRRTTQRHSPTWCTRRADGQEPANQPG